jgi:WS/DGAT/MGAT family acyltransferase
MQRLRGEDSQFIFQETRVQHQHTIKVVIVDPGATAGQQSWEAFRDGIAGVVPHYEPFRRRVVKVPFRLGHPWWIDDPVIDPDYHVRRATVSPPGGRRELDEVISLIASIGLERDRPLWQIWRVDGLSDGRLAYVTKIHHSLADGLAAGQLLVDILQDSPESRPSPRSIEALPRDAVPSRRWMVRSAAAHALSLIRAFPSLVLATLRWAGAAGRQRASGRRPLAAAFAVERMAWNEPLTPQRWFDHRTVAIADMRSVKDAHGVTLNDVFLAMVAGGLRRYLEERGALPGGELTVTIPAATRSPEEARAWGNRMTTWMVGLATDIDDPVERLTTIAERTKAARLARDQRGADLQGRYMDYWPLWSAVVNWLPTLMTRAGSHASYSVICANVPGPREPLFAFGAPVVEVISMGPLVKDLGLNVTGWSYCGDFTLGVVACREHVPDVWLVNDGIVEELAALLATVPSSAADDRLQPDA